MHDYSVVRDDSYKGTYEKAVVIRCQQSKI